MWKKLRCPEFQFFRKKGIQKKCITQKLKWNSKKKTLYFCRAQNSASIDTSINCVGWTVRPFGLLPRIPFFSFSVNNSFSMKKLEKKFNAFTPVYFRFYLCVQIFITIERIIKIFFCLYGSLKGDVAKFFIIFFPSNMWKRIKKQFLL